MILKKSHFCEKQILIDTIKQSGKTLYKLHLIKKILKIRFLDHHTITPK